MPQTDSTYTYTPFYDYTLNSVPTEFDSIEFSLDSVFAAIPRKEPKEVKSMFTDHQLQVNGSEAHLKPQSSPESWMFVVLVVIILSICTYFRRRRIEILDILQSAIDNRSMKRTIREYNLNHHTSLFPIVLLWSSNIALLIFYFTIDILKGIIPIHGSIIYIGLFIGCILFYVIRNEIFSFLGNTFKTPEAIDVYIKSNYIYGLIESMVISPLLLFVYYGASVSPIFTNITVIMVGILYLFRLCRSLKLFLTYTKFTQLHLFYYLCILEFIPIIFVIYGIIYM